jgi:hypothetical protein
VSLAHLRFAARLRVLYTATKPLPRPAGKYHLVPTHEEQMRDFETAQRRSPDYQARLRDGKTADLALYDFGQLAYRLDKARR